MRFFYSVLSAITGSCLLAFLEGINPPINVRIILSTINIIADLTDITAFILFQKTKKFLEFNAFFSAQK